MAVRLFYILFVSAFVITKPRITLLSSFKPEEKVLYIGVDNNIKLEGIKAYSAKLTISHGEIHKLPHNEYIVRVSTPLLDTLRIYQGKKLVAVEMFQVKILPHLISRLAHSEDSIATVSQVLANPFLTADLPNCNYKHQFSITSFKSSCITANMDTIDTFETRGNIFSDEQKSAIKSLKSGDQIYFYYIRAICPDCGGRALPPFKVYIQ